MEKMKKFTRIYELRLPFGKVKRTPLSGFEYFSQRFEMIFTSPDYSAILGHFNNYNKSILNLHGNLPNGLHMEAIPARFLKLPPHNLSFVTGPIVIIYGKIQPLNLLNDFETNPFFSDYKDLISPYLIIHNKNLISISDLVELQTIVLDTKNEYNEIVKDIFKLLNYATFVKQTNLFFSYSTLFQTTLSLLKTKIILNGNTDSTRT